MRALLLWVALAGAAPVSVDLPVSDAQFPAIGSVSADAINANCLACHSVEMVLNQPRLTPAQWQATVDKMRHVFQAPIEEGDVAAITAWLDARSASLDSKSTR